jgi:hypothetical protein
MSRVEIDAIDMQDVLKELMHSLWNNRFDSLDVNILFLKKILKENQHFDYDDTENLYLYQD